MILRLGPVSQKWDSSFPVMLSSSCLLLFAESVDACWEDPFLVLSNILGAEEWGVLAVTQERLFQVWKAVRHLSTCEAIMSSSLKRGQRSQ